MKNNIKQILVVLLFLITASVVAQTAPDTLYVTGIVSDAITSAPLQGIKVAVNESFSTFSNENGEYRMRIPFNDVIVKFSAPGYASRTVALQGESEKNVTLYRDIFTSVQQNNNAYSMTPSLTMDDEIKTRFAGDVRSISRSGAAAIGSNMYIRGFNTLNANAQPLFVVDGVVWDNPFNRESIHEGFYINSLSCIDVFDIESIEVIKDATSLYGSKGANGVIKIKTFGTKDQVTKIAFDAFFGINIAPKYPAMMNADQYRIYASEVLKDFPSFFESSNLFKDDPTLIFYNKYHNQTDWKDEVFQNGNTQRYGLNVSGGDEKAKYYFALGYTNASGVVKTTDYTRLNTRINSDIHLAKNFDVNTDIYYTNINRSLLDDGTNARTAPVMAASVKAPLFNPYLYTTDGKMLTTLLEDADDFGISNPTALIRNSDGTNNQYRLGIGIQPSWIISKYMKFENLFSFVLDNLKERSFIPMNGTAPVLLTGQGYSYNTVKDQTIEQRAIFNETKLDFNMVINRSHTLSALFGARIYGNAFKSAYIEGHNTGNDSRKNITNSLSFKKVGGGNDSWNSISYYLTAKYSFKERYSLSGVVDMDASSRFGTKTQDGFRLMGGTFAVFPSLKASWLVSGEPFMKRIPLIDWLEINAKWGITGNDDIVNMARYAYLSPVNYLGAGVGLEIANLANASLQWETTTKMGAGINLSVLNERITLSVDVFKHKTYNLLTLKQAPLLSALNNYWSNEGSLENTGYDLGLSFKILNINKLKWNMEVMTSHYANKITALPDGVDYTTAICEGEIQTAVGKPAGLFYGYKTNGVFSSDQEAMSANNGQGLQKQNPNASFSYFMGGDVFFDDKNKDGIINEKDRQVIGNPNPDLTGSMTHRFSFGRFMLDVFFTYSYGNDIYNYQRRLLESGSGYYNQSTNLLNRWKTDEQITSVPRAVYNDPMGNSRFSDRWIEDGSFLKLKDIRLSFEIPTKISEIEKLTCWIATSNLYTWTKYLGPDPEVSMNASVLCQGIDNALLPSSRSIYVGIKLNF